MANGKNNNSAPQFLAGPLCQYDFLLNHADAETSQGEV